jgi:hypothetical protein
MTIYKALMVRAQDGEQLLKQSMVELLTLPADCSLVALNPAHSSRLLPPLFFGQRYRFLCKN